MKADAIKINQTLRCPQPEPAIFGLDDGGDSIGRQAVGAVPGPAIVLMNAEHGVEGGSRNRPGQASEHGSGQEQISKSAWTLVMSLGFHRVSRISRTLRTRDAGLYGLGRKATPG